MRRAAALLFSVAVALPCSYFSFRTAHTPLASALEPMLRRALHRDDVAILSARLRAPARLELDGVRVGELGIGRVVASVSPWQILRGRSRPDRLELYHVALGEALTADAVDVRLSAGRARVSAREVAIRQGSLAGVTAGELGFEVADHALTRVAFAGTRLGPGDRAAVVDGLAGTLLRDADGFRLRAARPGLVVTGRFDAGRLDARATLESLTLQPFAALVEGKGLRVDEARASGQLEVRSSADDGLRLDGTLAIDGVKVQHRALAGRPVGPFALTLAGALVVAPGRLAVEKLSLRSGPLGLTIDGAVTRSGALLVKLELPRSKCGELLRSLPHDLLPALDGLVLDGELAGRVELAADLRHLGDGSPLGLDVRLDVGCRVLGDPPLADVRALATPLGWRALDVAQPSWRPLGSLPPQLIRTFLISEDGRFFQHHGFDLDMIRRALVADLALGRIDRGASTLSQQLVKNLYLTGERSAARKLEEAVLTWRLEQLVPKRRILEYYLNLVEFGPGIYGVAEAAERYFGKEPEELTADESAQLAALLPAPRRGMDAAWHKRYRALVQRIPSESVFIPGTDVAPVKLSQR